MANTSQYVGLDLNGQPLVNAVINPKTTTERLALALGLPGAGTIVFDTTLNSLFLWQGGSWLNLSNLTGMLRENAEGFTTKRDRFGRIVSVEWRFADGTTKLDRSRYANDTATEPSEVLLDTTPTAAFLGASITDPPPVYTNSYTINLPSEGTANTPHPLSFSPLGVGEFDPTLRITPTVTGVTGAFSSASLDPGSSNHTFSASTTGAATLSFSNNKNAIITTQNMAIVHQLVNWQGLSGTTASGSELTLPQGVNTYAHVALNEGWRDFQFVVDGNANTSKVNWTIALADQNTNVPVISTRFAGQYNRLVTISMDSYPGASHRINYGMGNTIDGNGTLASTTEVSAGLRVLSLRRVGNTLTLRSSIDGGAWVALGSTIELIAGQPYYILVLRSNNTDFNGTQNAGVLRVNPVIY